MNIAPHFLLIIFLVVFVSQTEQAGPFGKRLIVYADSACTKYLAESHLYYPGSPCTPLNCSLYQGNYATVDCSADLSVYPKEETIGVAIHLDACVTDYLRYMVAANATGQCLISAAGTYYIVTTNACPTRTVVDVYQFRVNGACQTNDGHWDTSVGQCTHKNSYYSELICPVAPTPPVTPPISPPETPPITPPITPPVTPSVPVTPPVMAPFDAPIEAPVIAPEVVPVTPIGNEPVEGSQPLEAPVNIPVIGPVKAPKARLSFGTSVTATFMLMSLLFVLDM